MASSAASFVASLTDPATIRAELARTLALQEDICSSIPGVIAATTVDAAGTSPLAHSSGISAGAGRGAGAGASAAGGEDDGDGASLAPLVSELEALARQTSALATEMGGASQTAQQSIGRVRELDGKLTRAQAALERVEDILDLQQCLGGVQSCLQRGDLLGAAATVKKFKAVEKVIPVATEDKELMKRAEERLLRTVAARFDVAVAENNSSEVTLCCQLMSVLGNSRQGLERYATYVDDLLAQYVQEQQQRFKSEDGKAEAVNQLSTLFSKGASLLKQAEALADKFMTDDAQTQVLVSVHTTIDSLGAGIMNSLLRHRRIKAALQLREVSLAAVESVWNDTAEDVGGTGLLPPELADDEAPRETDALLKELAIVCQRCVSYERLMHGKAVRIDAVAHHAEAQAAALRIARHDRRWAASGSGDGDGSGDSAPEERVDTVDKLRGRNQLAQALGELAGVYSMLEEVYMSVTLVQIVAEDEVNEDLSGSVMCEDAFFILQKCGVRAIDTGNSDCACSVVNHVCRLLARTVLAELKGRTTRLGRRNGDPTLTSRQESRFARLQERIAGIVAEMEEEEAAAEATLDAFARDGSGSGLLMSPSKAKPSTSSDKPGAKRLSPDASFAAVGLNNLLAGMSNTQQLRGNLIAEMDGVFTEELPRAKLKSCLSELEAVVVEFRTSLASGLSRLCASLTPRLRGIMTPMEGSTPTIHYELTEEDFTDTESYDIFAHELLKGLAGIVSPFQMVLVPELYRRMVNKVAMYMGKQIEGVLRRRKFNQLGGLRLDRDVRALQSTLVKECGGERAGVRERLKRLSELGRVLSMTSVDDVQVHWESRRGDASYPLSGEELVQFASQRVDWSAADVAALQLE